MSNMPPSPFFNSGESLAPLPDEAAALVCSQARGAAADIPGPPSSTGGFQEALAADAMNPHESASASEDICHIHEIFYFSRKLIEDDHRFVLDESKFMFDIGHVPPAARPENFAKYMAVLDALDDEPMPLFLQQARA